MKYTPRQYALALADLLEEKPGDAQEIIRRFAGILVSHGQVRKLAEISHAFEREWNKRTGIVPVAITTAVKGALSIHALESLLGKKASVSETVDPNIIAGARIRIDDWQIDNTLERRFDELKQALTS